MENINVNVKKEKTENLEEKITIPELVLTSEQENQVSERFKFLWEQYSKIVNLCITLSAGTLLIFANNIFSTDNLEKFKIAGSLIKLYAISSVLFIFIGLLFAITWRILSQIYMEKEVFGSSNIIIKYLKDAHIYEHSYKFEEKKIILKENCG